MLLLSSSKRFQSLTGQESISLSAANGTAASSGNDFDSLKQEILSEVRKEIQKAKLEIIEGRKGLLRSAVVQILDYSVYVFI